jgi:glyoxylase I family protein
VKLEISGISHAAIRVPDLARSRRFYVDLLGLPVLLEVDGLVLVGVGTGLLGIRGDDPGTQPDDRFDPHRVGLDHLSFTVDSLAVLERMKQALDETGVPNEGIKDEALLDAKALVFYDPDGIALELYFIWAPAEPT